MAEVNPVKHSLNKPLHDHLWKKGQSGNPNGRPRNEQCITPILRKFLKAKPPILREGRNYAELIAITTLEGAVTKGGWRDRDLVYNRIDGKVIEKVELNDKCYEDLTRAFREVAGEGILPTE